MGPDRSEILLDAETFDSSESFRGSRAILSAFQHASACEGEGWASQHSKYGNIYWYGRAPASMGKIYGIFWEGLSREAHGRVDLCFPPALPLFVCRSRVSRPGG
eukprot:1466708-Prymnesium_polylepis.1